jgi:hypothetical protein
MPLTVSAAREQQSAFSNNRDTVMQLKREMPTVIPTPSGTC